MREFAPIIRLYEAAGNGNSAVAAAAFITFLRVITDVMGCLPERVLDYLLRNLRTNGCTGGTDAARNRCFREYEAGLHRRYRLASRISRLEAQDASVMGKAGVLTDLVPVLKAQHDAGRKLTDQVLSLVNARGNDDRTKLAQGLRQFVRMYRPHEAREDTILFPALRKIVSPHEFDALGELFEKNEHKQFGADGFEMYRDKVADMEKQLGIYDLAQFTPKV